MNCDERRALHLTLSMLNMGYHATHVIGEIYADGVLGLMMTVKLNEAPNDLDFLKAEMNGRLAEHGFYITDIEQSDRVTPVHVFCKGFFSNAIREHEM